jgi:ABC-2 type transport system ATP-binding protein
VILDELTSGLDPAARRGTWELVEKVRDRGVTVVLVTHFMDEAQRLCDRVALIDAGRVAALGTPAALAERVGHGKRVRFRPSGPFDPRLLTDLPEVADVERQGEHVVVSGSGQLVNAVILTLAAAGVTALDVELQAASLEDAFLALTGQDAGQRSGERRPAPTGSAGGSP